MSDHLEVLARRSAGTQPGVEPRTRSPFQPGAELRAGLEDDSWPGRAAAAPPPDGSTSFAEAEGAFPPLVRGPWPADAAAPSLAAILGSGPPVEPVPEPEPLPDEEPVAGDDDATPGLDLRVLVETTGPATAISGDQPSEAAAVSKGPRAPLPGAIVRGSAIAAPAADDSRPPAAPDATDAVPVKVADSRPDAAPSTAEASRAPVSQRSAAEDVAAAPMPGAACDVSQLAATDDSGRFSPPSTPIPPNVADSTPVTVAPPAAIPSQPAPPFDQSGVEGAPEGAVRPPASPEPVNAGGAIITPSSGEPVFVGTAAGEATTPASVQPVVEGMSAGDIVRRPAASSVAAASSSEVRPTAVDGAPRDSAAAVAAHPHEPITAADGTPSPRAGGEAPIAGTRAQGTPDARPVQRAIEHTVITDVRGGLAVAPAPPTDTDAAATRLPSSSGAFAAGAAQAASGGSVAPHVHPPREALGLAEADGESGAIPGKGAVAAASPVPATVAPHVIQPVASGDRSAEIGPSEDGTARAAHMAGSLPTSGAPPADDSDRPATDGRSEQSSASLPASGAPIQPSPPVAERGSIQDETEAAAVVSDHGSAARVGRGASPRPADSAHAGGGAPVAVAERQHPLEDRGEARASSAASISPTTDRSGAAASALTGNQEAAVVRTTSATTPAPPSRVDSTSLDAPIQLYADHRSGTATVGPALEMAALGVGGGAILVGGVASPGAPGLVGQPSEGGAAEPLAAERAAAEAVAPGQPRTQIASLEAAADSSPTTRRGDRSAVPDERETAASSAPLDPPSRDLSPVIAPRSTNPAQFGAAADVDALELRSEAEPVAPRGASSPPTIGAPKAASASSGGTNAVEPAASSGDRTDAGVASADGSRIGPRAAAKPAKTLGSVDVGAQDLSLASTSFVGTADEVIGRQDPLLSPAPTRAAPTHARPAPGAGADAHPEPTAHRRAGAALPGAPVATSADASRRAAEEVGGADVRASRSNGSVAGQPPVPAGARIEHDLRHPSVAPGADHAAAFAEPTTAGALPSMRSPTASGASVYKPSTRDSLHQSQSHSAISTSVEGTPSPVERVEARASAEGQRAITDPTPHTALMPSGAAIDARGAKIVPTAAAAGESEAVSVEPSAGAPAASSNTSAPEPSSVLAAEHSARRTATLVDELSGASRHTTPTPSTPATEGRTGSLARRAAGAGESLAASTEHRPSASGGSSHVDPPSEPVRAASPRITEAAVKAAGDSRARHSVEGVAATQKGGGAPVRAHVAADQRGVTSAVGATAYSAAPAAERRAEAEPAHVAARVPARGGAQVVPVGAAQEASKRALAGAGGRNAVESEPAIHIDVGRVDVRAAATATQGPRVRRAPALTLERYLRQGGRRG